MKRIFPIILALMLLCVGSIRAQGEFNPQNPAEPQVPVFYYPLTVTCQPAGAGYVSGKGNYVPGTQVTVSTSANSGYTFNHWELNGVRYNAEGMSFSYTTTEDVMDFVAVYDFTPNNPSEPTLNVKSRLFLASEPQGICTFNRTSGEYVEADQYVNVSITGVDQLYEFTGWYLNGNLLTTEAAFNYLVTYSDATLTAHFRELPFNPVSPADPSTAAGQTDIQTHAKGDANADGVINITDVVAVINVYLTEDTTGVHEKLADANGDGVINITDAVLIINLYLTNF
ncbi:MAG: dockerin type I repeat-containing protein [Bacteroidaceae bacterium]|nr:dockerin type I repeat-containing protein [Bacteroidaceae bacterium]